MRVLHFDLSAGAAGDMLMAALLDAGAPGGELARVLAELDPRISFRTEPVHRAGFAALKARILVDGREELPADPPPDAHAHGSHVHPHGAREGTHPHSGDPHGHTHLSQIRSLLGASRLDAPLREEALAVFTSLFQAEAQAHGLELDEVGLHEAGALDAVADVVGVLWAVRNLAPGRITASPVNVGSGAVKCAHGTVPVPVPAVTALLAGLPVHSSGPAVEMTTPTGAALVRHLCASFGPPPAMRLARTGTGAGNRDPHGFPNILRVFVGEAEGGGDAPVWQLETQVDDASGKEVRAALDALLAAGALDAWSAPVVMKKGRPGHLVAYLATEPHVAACEDALFGELPTLGIRRFRVERTVMDRREAEENTPYGAVKVKRAQRGVHRVVSVDEDQCRAIARREGVAVREVRNRLLRDRGGEHV